MKFQGDCFTPQEVSLLGGRIFQMHRKRAASFIKQGSSLGSTSLITFNSCRSTSGNTNRMHNRDFEVPGSVSEINPSGSKAPGTLLSE